MKMIKRNLFSPPSSISLSSGRLSGGRGGKTLTGDVTYNGDALSSGKFEPSSVAHYVQQIDDHEPYLTTKETMEFAGACTTSIDKVKRIYTAGNDMLACYS